MELLQADNGSRVAYLVTAITTLVAVIGLLARYLQKQITAQQESNAKQVESAHKNLEEERAARKEEFKIFVTQLDGLSRQTREAHQEEMKQVLERLAESDRIAARQTEILSQLRRDRNK